MENFMHLFEFFHVQFKYKLIFFSSEDILSVLIVYGLWGGNYWLEVSPNYVKEDTEGISKTKS